MKVEILRDTGILFNSLSPGVNSPERGCGSMAEKKHTTGTRKSAKKGHTAMQSSAQGQPGPPGPTGTAEDYKIGDMVEAKCGGPVMCVSEINPTSLQCVYWSETNGAFVTVSVRRELINSGAAKHGHGHK